MPISAAQTVAHLVIMFFIVIGNIAYFVTRDKIHQGPTS